MRRLVLLCLIQVGCSSNEYPDKPKDSTSDHAGSGGGGTQSSNPMGGATAYASGGNTSGPIGGTTPASTDTTTTSAGGSGAGVAGSPATSVGSGGANAAAGSTSAEVDTTRWVGSWATAQQLTETSNLPPSPGLSNNTLRQIFQVSIGGSKIRLRFSNEFGSSPVTLKAVHCAKSTSLAAIDMATDKTLSFKGAASVTIPAGQAVYSDGFEFALAPLSRLAVSIYFGDTSPDVTGHPGSRTTSYLQIGDAAAAANLTTTLKPEHWYILSGLDVAADESTKALAILGDSITDGRGSTTNEQNRWPDDLAKRLQGGAGTTKVGVLNLGIGGNTILSGGLGPTATLRFDRDILGQAGVRWAIVFEGVNDIGYSSSSIVATNLIAAYTQFVTKAHDHGLLAYGATITPFGQNSYYSDAHEQARQTVNQWIRTPGNFDAVIDFDAAVRDTTTPSNLTATYSSDWLHLNPAGYQKMADSIDLTLFTR